MKDKLAIVKHNINNDKFWHYLISLRYIKLFAYWSARGLAKKLDQSHKHKYVYYYGFQVIYGGANKWLLLLLVGFVLHILPQIIVGTLSFMFLRVYIGGLHYDSYTKCSWISLACLVTVGLLAKYIPYNTAIHIIIFAYLFLIICIYAPVEHKNRILTKNDKKRFKYISIAVMAIYGILSLTLCNNSVINSILYGTLLSGIIALPAFNKRGKSRQV